MSWEDFVFLDFPLSRFTPILTLLHGPPHQERRTASEGQTGDMTNVMLLIY